MAVEYEIGEELDNLDITWLDADGNVRNLSSGWTFEFKLGTEGKAALLTKRPGSPALPPRPTLSSRGPSMSWSSPRVPTGGSCGPVAPPTTKT
jgi:hypothetical protein